MKVDFLRYEAGTYEALLKVVSYKGGWKRKVREYTHEKLYDLRKPTIQEIAVYVLNSRFEYLYTKNERIDNYPL